MSFDQPFPRIGLSSIFLSGLALRPSPEQIANYSSFIEIQKLYFFLVPYACIWLWHLFISVALFLSLHMQYFMLDEYTAEDNRGMYESKSSESLSSASLPHHQASQTLEKDLIVVILQIYRYQLS